MLLHSTCPCEVLLELTYLYLVSATIIIINVGTATTTILPACLDETLMESRITRLLLLFPFNDRLTSFNLLVELATF
jgi:hypothetical protein